MQVNQSTYRGTQLLEAKDVKENWIATGTARVVAVDDSYLKENAVDRFTVLQNYETQALSWGTRLGNLAAGVEKVALLTLAVVSIIGFFILLCTVDDLTLGAGKNFSKFMGGKKVITVPLIAT